MAYQTIPDFSAGDVLTAAQINQILDNIEAVRDSSGGGGHGRNTSSAVSTSNSSTYSGSPIVSVTESFDGRPVLLFILGGVTLGVGASNGPFETNAFYDCPIGYKVDSGSVVNALARFNPTVPSSFTRTVYYYGISFYMSMMTVITGISAGQHTIGLHLKGSRRLEGHAGNPATMMRVSSTYDTVKWHSPGLFVTEASFASL